MNSFLENWSPRALSVLRIIIGFLFFFHGTQKLFNYPPKEGFTAAAGLMLLAGVLEFGGGALFLIGLLTRPVAFILCGLMAVAYFIDQRQKSARRVCHKISDRHHSAQNKSDRTGE